LEPKNRVITLCEIKTMTEIIPKNSIYEYESKTSNGYWVKTSDGKVVLFSKSVVTEVDEKHYPRDHKEVRDDAAAEVPQVAGAMDGSTYITFSGPVTINMPTSGNDIGDSLKFFVQEMEKKFGSKLASPKRRRS
jgi:hypothetical protein